MPSGALPTRWPGGCFGVVRPQTEDIMTTFKRILLLTSVLAALGGCGPGDGSSGMQATESADAGATCQQPSSNQSAAAQAFIGSWRYATLNTTCTCDDGTTPSSSTDGAEIETFVAGCEPNQV